MDIEVCQVQEAQGQCFLHGTEAVLQSEAKPAGRVRGVVKRDIRGNVGGDGTVDVLRQELVVDNLKGEREGERRYKSIMRLLITTSFLFQFDVQGLNFDKSIVFSVVIIYTPYTYNAHIHHSHTYTYAHTQHSYTYTYIHTPYTHTHIYIYTYAVR